MSSEGSPEGAAVKKRSVAIDVVRVVALTGVIIRHTWYYPEGIVAQIMCPWAIAAFFVLTGYLWSKHKTLAKEIDTRATGLLLPYVVWTVLISIPYFIWVYPQVGAAWGTRLLLADFYGAQLMVLPFSVSWFFTVMFIAVVLLRYLERFPRRATWGILLVTVVITLVMPKLLWFPPLGAGLALVCMLFIVLGQEFRRVRHHITRPIPAGLAALVVGGVAVWLGAAHNLDGVLIEVKLSTYGYPVAGLLTGVLISYGLILLAEGFEKWIPEKAAPYITEAAATATFSMFLHPCLLFIMGTPPTGRFADFLVVLLVPYIIAVVCLRRGWLPWLTGAPRPPLPVAETVGRMPVVGRMWQAVVRT